MPERIEQVEKHAADQYQQRGYLQAAQLFGEAAELYRLEGNTVKEAEMQNNRSVAMLQAGEAALALQAAAGTDQVFALAGDVRRQAMAMGNQAAALEDLGRQREALEHYQQASALLKSGGETEMRSIILKRISSLQMRSGKSLESLAAMDTALSIEKPSSPKEKLLQKLLNFVRRRIG